MTTHISLKDRDVREKISKLTPTNGYLVMADLVGSAALKNGKPFESWAPDFLFPFANIEKNTRLEAFKMVGDMAMYWVADSNNPQPEEIMAGLTHVQTHAPGKFKMAFVRCRGVYEVSFHKKVSDDLYGADIDLTARLLGKARPAEILLNSACRDDVVRNTKGFAYPLRGLGTWNVKGFSDPIEVFSWQVGT